MFFKILITILLGYLLGSFSGAYFISKKYAKIDIRRYGSGNAGTTNVLRTLGLKYAVPTLLIDVLKAVVASLLGLWIIGHGAWGIVVGGYSCILGHTFPIFMDFKGGKGIATFAGVILVLNPGLGVILLIVGIIFNILIKVYSIVSVLGVFVTAVLFSVLTKGSDLVPTLLFVWVMFLQTLITHKNNLKRIRNGQENQLDIFSKKPRRNLK